MHGYKLQKVIKLCYVWKLEGKMSFLNSWMLEFVVIECVSLKNSSFGVSCI